MSEPRFIVERDIVIPMRDGTRTVADVYRPDDDKRHPVVLSRTVYGKEGTSDMAYAGPISWVRSGYAFVSQDCRGCFGSEGTLEFLLQEQDDGYDSVEWAASQLWSSGKVGVVGASAVAMVGWQAVAARPPSLAAAILSVGTADMEGLSKRNGALSEFYFSVDYILNFCALNIRRLDIDDAERKELEAQIAELGRLTKKDLEKLPPWDYPVLRDPRINGNLWNIYMAEPTDPFWKKDETSAGKDPSRVDVPVMAVSGFFDPFAASMARAASNPDLGHKVILGPWGHFGVYGFPYGTRSHRDAPGGASWTPVSIAWFNRWLKGDPAPPEPGSSKVYFFQSGENAWNESPTWPPAGTPREIFLSSGGDAASAEGGGALLFERPHQTGRREYTYDPADPAETIGGVIVSAFHQFARFDPAFAADAVQDQRPLESRQDVLVYTSAELDDPLRLAGPVKVNLWVSSSAEDTDFFVRLLDVEPNGFVANVTEGFIRTRYRDGRNDSWLTPGEPVELQITTDPLAHTFLSGHKIRVHITSSSFPKFSRNLNSRAIPEFGTEADIVVAEQTVLDGPDTPSRLTFNIVPPPNGQTPYIVMDGRAVSGSRALITGAKNDQKMA